MTLGVRSLTSSTVASIPGNGTGNGTGTGTPSNPRLRRLASKPLKPLKLAASAIGSVPGRISGKHDKDNASPPSSATAAHTSEEDEVAATPSSASGSVPTSTTTGTTAANSAYLELPATEKKRRKIPGRRKHPKSVSGLSGILDATQIAQVAQGPRKPLEQEEPAAILRVRVVSAEGLVVKDRNGFSDP
jgi:phosphatidylserine decarboxylase